LLGHAGDPAPNSAPGPLVPLTIPLGSIASRATQIATLGGILSPLVDVADAPSIIESSPLGDNTLPFPGSSNLVDISFNIQASPADFGMDAANYIYQFTFYNTRTGSESRPSPPIAGPSIVETRRQLLI